MWRASRRHHDLSKWSNDYTTPGLDLALHTAIIVTSCCTSYRATKPLGPLASSHSEDPEKPQLPRFVLDYCSLHHKNNSSPFSIGMLDACDDAALAHRPLLCRIRRIRAFWKTMFDDVGLRGQLCTPALASLLPTTGNFARVAVAANSIFHVTG